MTATVQIRVITPKRDKGSGELYHYCPLTDARIGPRDCVACPVVDRVEQLPNRYRIHCGAPQTGPALKDFEPPKAHDTYRGLTGTDCLKSEVHTWVEPKLDGVRAIVHCTPEGVIITTRRRDKTGKFSQIQDNLPHLRDHPVLTSIGKAGYTILDGEVIMPVDDDTLAVTMGVVGSKPERAIALQQAKGMAVLHVFDMPWYCGADLSASPFAERVVKLTQFCQAVPIDPHIKLVESSSSTDPAYKQEFLTEMLDRGLEGVVIKNPRAGYFDSQAWLKVKQRASVDAIVTGWEPGVPGGKYADTIGALLVSVIDSATGQLREICKVTPGDDATRDRWFKAFSAKTTEGITASGIIVELEGQIVTKDGRMRHPRILRYRADRSEPNAFDFTTNQVVR